MRWISIVATMALVFGLSFNTLAADPADKKVEVVFETTAGNFVIELSPDKAPIGTANFLEYVKAGFYTGIIFHRVIPDFMIQGGGYDEKYLEKTSRAPIKNEANNGLKNLRGTLSYARTADPNSATSQFFINVVDNARLDPVPGDPSRAGYAVFGKVVSGMDVVDKIRYAKIACPSNVGRPCPPPVPNGMMDVPEKPVVIKKAYVKA